MLEQRTFANVVDDGQLEAVHIIVARTLHQQRHNSHSVHMVCDALRLCDISFDPACSRGCLRVGR